MVKKLCDRMRKLRRDREISQAQLGLILSVSQQAIDKWEHGTTEPSNEMLIKIALFYAVTTDYLLGLTDEMNPPYKKKHSDL